MNVDLVKEVYDISDELVNLPNPHRKHVTVDNNKIMELSNAILSEGKVSFYDKEPQEYSSADTLHVIVRELVASSINYCYWYGNSTIRPGNASSTMMYNLVDEAMQFFSMSPKKFAGHINYLIELLALKRFPLLEERKRHLLELVENGKALTFARYVNIRGGLDDLYSANCVFEELVKNFPGFASDTFLKRASLFMIQIYRQLGWWNSFMNKLFVPADYQIPKMLEAKGCIKYSSTLEGKIQEGRHIHKSCLMEVQLRAATIVACRKLCKQTGWNIADIDTWLWTKRKDSKHIPARKFHLTVTTDY